MMTKLILALAAIATSTAFGETYFSETFDDKDWESRWVTSSWKSATEIGKFSHVQGEDYDVSSNDFAIKTSQDARFYGLSAKFTTPLMTLNGGKTLYISYLVQHEQKIDCGGAYLKLLPTDLDQSTFGGESPYTIMFGPDICGNTKKTHAILNYKRPIDGATSENMDHQSNIRAESDTDAHLYTFSLNSAENTYAVKIDGEIIKEGTLVDNWPFFAPKMIKDPNVSKPTDWVDDKMMPDPEAVKPAGYDDIPATIPDPEAEKPDDWDDDDDGEWEPAMIANPEYKGEWKPPMIENPDYKGPWVHPEIENPEYVEVEDLVEAVIQGAASKGGIGAIGFELWQVKSGTLFDDILVTDEENVYKEHETHVLAKTKAMREKKEKIEAEKRKEEEDAAKKAEDEKKEEVEEEMDEKDEL